MTKIYLSGKISGLSENEYKANFYYADLELSKQHSHLYSVSEIINPVLLKHFFKNWLGYMATDIYHLRKCTHIAMMPNWIDSKCACIEHYFGKFIFKLEVIYL